MAEPLLVTDAATACTYLCRQADTALAEFLHEVKSASFVDYRRLTQILVRAACVSPTLPLRA